MHFFLSLFLFVQKSMYVLIFTAAYIISLFFTFCIMFFLLPGFPFVSLFTCLHKRLFYPPVCLSFSSSSYLSHRLHSSGLVLCIHLALFPVRRSEGLSICVSASLSTCPSPRLPVNPTHCISSQLHDHVLTLLLFLYWFCRSLLERA